MSIIQAFQRVYRAHYRKLMLIPIILGIASVLIIASKVASTGDLFNRDISLRGGTSVTVHLANAIDKDRLESSLQKSVSEYNIRYLSEFGSEKVTGLILETSMENEALLRQALESGLGYAVEEENISIEVVGSSLGTSFYRQMLKAILWAFLFIAIIVFLLFRAVVPALASVGSVFFDITVTIAMINLLGMNISSAGISALLLLIGYSVDTDILQTSRTLKEKSDDVFERIFSSMKTGITMTSTVIAAVLVSLVISTAPALKEMFTILVIGLFADIVMTYLMNAPLLINYELKQHPKS